MSLEEKINTNVHLDKGVNRIMASSELASSVFSIGGFWQSVIYIKR